MGRLPLTVLLALVLLTAADAFAETTLTGAVTLPDGGGSRPAVGAKVKLFYCVNYYGFGSRWLAETKTDAAGKFVIQAPDVDPPVALVGNTATSLRSYLVVLQSDCVAAVREVDARGKIKEYTFELEAGVDVPCTVVDPNGAPVKGAIVGLSEDNANPDLRGSFAEAVLAPEIFHSSPTSEKGETFLRNVAAGRMKIWAIHEQLGYGDTKVSEPGQASSEGTPAATAKATPVKIQLSGKMQKARGKVIYAENGEPAAGMIVYARIGPVRGTCRTWYAVTGKEGEFSISYPAHITQRGYYDIVAMDPSPNPAHASATVPSPTVENMSMLIAMPVGRSITAKVRDRKTGTPLRNATVCAKWDGRDFRLTDAAGKCRFRVTGDYGLSIAGVPPGRALLADDELEKHCTWDGPAETTFNLATLSVHDGALKVTGPDGRPVADSYAVLSAPGVYVRLSTGDYSDREGNIRVRDIPDGRDATVFVRCDADDPLLAAKVRLKRDAGAERLPVTLRPAPKALIVLQDAEGRRLPEDVRGRIGIEPFGVYANLASSELERVDGDLTATFAGLLPNVDYDVNIEVRINGVLRGYEDFGVRGPWRFNAGDEHPRLVLQYDPTRQHVWLPHRPRATTNENFEEECDAFAALPATVDPVQEDLTWYVLKEGIGLIDSENRQVKRFTELLDETHFVVAAMAFGKDKVWVGTNKGLFAWNRKDMFWTRYAVGGEFVDLPVKAVSLSADGERLSVSIMQDGREKSFVFAIKSGKWQQPGG